MNTTDSTTRPGPRATRRRQILGALAGATASLLLTACGGGGDGASPPPAGGTPPVGGPPPAGPGTPSAPQIGSFEASTTLAWIGDSVRLRAEFTGGSGRIDPDIGFVTAGGEAISPPLDRDREFRLVVSSAGGEVSRSLRVGVRYRDRITALGLTYAASRQSALALMDGSVLLLGGTRGDGMASDAVDRYDPRTNGIHRIGTLRIGRVGATAALLADGTVLVVGGELSLDDGREAERFDPRSGSSSPAGTLSVRRVDHAMVALPGGRVLVSGGVTLGEGGSLGVSRSAEIWEPSTGRFRRLDAPMHTARTGHTMTVLPDGSVLVAGGYTSTEAPALAEIFDPRTETFRPVVSGLTMRAHHLAAALPDGTVLLIGGEQQVPGSDEPEILASVLRFDPVSGLFRELPPLQLPRTAVRGAVLPSGQVLLFGGQSRSTEHAWTGERYDPAGAGRATALLDGERAHHQVLRLPNGRVLVIGGESRLGQLARSVLVYD